MPVTPITSLAEFESKINGDKPVVIDFWAEWCGPCRMISPVLERLSNEVLNVEFCKVNVDEVGDVSQGCGIKAMPTFQVYSHGKRVGELVGAHPQKLEAFVTQVAEQLA